MARRRVGNETRLGGCPGWIQRAEASPSLETKREEVQTGTSNGRMEGVAFVKESQRGESGRKTETYGEL